MRPDSLNHWWLLHIHMLSSALRQTHTLTRINKYNALAHTLTFQSPFSPSFFWWREIQRLASGAFSSFNTPTHSFCPHPLQVPPSICLSDTVIDFVNLTPCTKRQTQEFLICTCTRAHLDTLRVFMWAFCHMRPRWSSLKSGISRARLSSGLAFISLFCCSSSLSPAVPRGQSFHLSFL